MGMGEMIMSLLDNFSFHNAWITVVMIIFLICGVGGATFWVWIRYVQFKYSFEILDIYGNSTFKKAKLVKNKQGIRKFCIQGYENPEQWQSIGLEPIRIINGKKFRQVASDGKGNLVPTTGLRIVYDDLNEEEIKELKAKLKVADIDEKYITKFRLNKKKYLETSLTEVEKTVQAYAIMEANQDHNVLDTMQKYTIGIIAVLCVFMFLMLFFQVKGIIQVTSSAQSTANSLNLAGDKLVRVAQSMDRRTEMEKLLYKQAFGDNFSMELPLG